ncbi:hypothetical protein Vretifemale_20278, partial [Volvox reticuliferus]
GSKRQITGSAAGRNPIRRRYNDAEDEEWGIGSTDDDDDKFVNRRHAGGSAVQPGRRSGKLAPPSQQHPVSKQRRQQQFARMRSSGRQMVSLFSPRGAGAATRPADRDRSGMKSADVITIESSDEDKNGDFRDAFRSADRNQLNGGQRPIKNRRRSTTRAAEDAHTDEDENDDDDDDDDDDVLYGRRGGDAVYDTYDSGGGYGTGYYTTDLDADLEGFIDDRVRMSTSEDDDDELRNKHERRARLYERFELQKEKEALLPALRRDHLRFGSPSLSL